jgi:hypothetical protein
MFGLKKMEKQMSDIADKIDALAVAVATLTTAVAAISTAAPVVPAPVVDFTPVLDAIAAVSAKLEPTPAAA